MKPVADTLHLQKRGDLYSFFRRVPTHLVPVLGRTFIKKALGVSSLAEAKKLRAIEEVRANALFDAAEKGLAGQGAGTAAQPLSMDVLTEHVRGAVDRLDKRAAKGLLEDPPANGDERAEIRTNVELDIQTLDDPADPNGHQAVRSVALKVAAANGVDMARPDFPTDAFLDLIRRGLLEVERRQLGRVVADHGRTHYDIMFDPKRAPTMTFGQLCDAFIAQQMTEYEANGVSEKRGDNIKAKLGIIREIVGESVPVHTIDDDVISAARVMLAKTPNHRTILFSKLTLQAAIEKAAKDGKPVLGPKSQNFYLDLLSGVLKLGVRKKMLTSNPAEGVRALVKDKVAAGDKRRPFSDAQMAKFFTSDFYKACAAGAYTKPDRSWRFWTPLIQAFSGARLNEVCTLTVADFGATPAGTPFFAVNDEAESKSIKNENSRRKVPVHPQLVAVGLLTFVEERRKADGDKARLFPQLKPDPYGDNFGWYPSRRFNQVWLPREMGLEPRQTMHSFRHSVRDALRRSKAGADTLLHVCGWAPAGKATSDSYGSLNDPDLHAEAVAAISYGGLDLSFLYPLKG